MYKPNSCVVSQQTRQPNNELDGVIICNISWYPFKGTIKYSPPSPTSLSKAINAARFSEIIVGEDAAIAPLDRLTNGTVFRIQLMAFCLQQVKRLLNQVKIIQISNKNITKN